MTKRHCWKVSAIAGSNDGHKISGSANSRVEFLREQKGELKLEEGCTSSTKIEFQYWQGIKVLS